MAINSPTKPDSPLTAESTRTALLETGLFIGLLLVVALLAVSSAIAYRNIQHLHDHSADVAETDAALDALNQLASTVKDAETGERGFLITGDRSYLEPYNAAVAAIDEEMKYLGELMRDNPRQQASFPTLRGLIAAKRKELQHGIDVRTDQGFQAARKAVEIGTGRRTMDSIREVAHEIAQAERERLARRAQIAERSYQIAVATEVFSGALGLCIVGAFMILLRRYLLARSRAADALRAEKERFGTTLASIGDAVIATDSSGCVTFLNPMAQSLTGWTQAEAAGQPLDKVFRIVNEQTRETVGNPALRALREGVVVGLANSTVLVARDGKERSVDDSAAPIRDPHKGTIGAVLAFRDITARKRAQDALKFLAESGTLLSSSLNYDATLKNVARLAVNALSDYCFFDLLTDDGEIKRVAWAHKDPEQQVAMGEIWRYVPAKTFANDPVIKTLVTGQTQFVPRVDDRWLRETATSPEHYKYMRDMKCFSLMTVPVAVKGRTLGALTFCRCVEGEPHYTEVDRNLAEELGRRAGLAVQNAILHQQLEQSAEELRRADRRKDEFLAVLAHELRNPLAPLRSGLEIMQRMGKEGYSAERAQEMMERQLQQMVRLIDDLLDITRVTEGRLELRKEPVELAAVIKNAMEVSRPSIEGARQRFTVSLPPEPVFLDADPMRLGQVFSNLLNNAAKYSERGASIALTAEREGDHVVVAVKDAGIGIPAEMLIKVFEPFTQVGGSLEHARGGLGIGLTLVKQLVGMHGGTVEARSEGAGKGSEFRVRLPVAAVPAERSERRKVGAKVVAGDTRSFRILVADDNEDAADALSALLRMMGHDARVAYDGVEAVKLAEIFRPEVILLDIGMPRLSGHDAARDIRAQPWGKEITLIALTGYGQSEDKRRTKEAGFDHHLVKPADIAALERLLVGLRPTAA